MTLSSWGATESASILPTLWPSLWTKIVPMPPPRLAKALPSTGGALRCLAELMATSSGIWFASSETFCAGVLGIFWNYLWDFFVDLFQEQNSNSRPNDDLAILPQCWFCLFTFKTENDFFHEHTDSSAMLPKTRPSQTKCTNTESLLCGTLHRRVEGLKSPRLGTFQMLTLSSFSRCCPRIKYTNLVVSWWQPGPRLHRSSCVAVAEACPGATGVSSDRSPNYVWLWRGKIRYVKVPE